MIDAFQSAEPVNSDAAYKAWQTAGHRAIMHKEGDQRTAGPIPTFGSMVHETALASQGMHYAPAHGAQPANGEKPDIAYKADGGDEFSFNDVLDIINPLQHLPIIGSIYRNMTGDTIKPFSSIIGASIFGGPVGAVSSTVNVCLKQTTGRDIAENALALVGFDNTKAPSSTPHIEYQNSFAGAAEHLDPAQFQIAANAYTAGVQKNFAAVKAQAQNWNA